MEEKIKNPGNLLGKNKRQKVLQVLQLELVLTFRIKRVTLNIIWIQSILQHLEGYNIKGKWKPLGQPRRENVKN